MDETYRLFDKSQALICAECKRGFINYNITFKIREYEFCSIKCMKEWRRK